MAADERLADPGLRRTPKRIAQGLGVLVLAVLLAGWFASGGGLGRITSPSAEVIGTVAADIDVVDRWVAEGLDFTHAPASLPAGPISVALELPSPGPAHNVVLEGYNDGLPILQASDPGRYVADVALQAGTYRYWCGVGGHRGAGMEGTVVVR